MKPSTTVLLLVTAMISAAVFLPLNVRADVELIVDQNQPADNVTHFQTIQGAINYADGLVNGQTPTTTQFTVRVEAGTYNEAITLKPGIPIRGRETAKTILTGGGSGTIVTATSISGDISISDFTFRSASIGVSSSSSSVSIANNIFNLGTSGTAVQVRSAPSTAVVNNVFYQNKTGVDTDTDITITNNIFSNNTQPYASTLTALSKVTYNDFYPDTTGALLATGATNTSVDPLFVNVSQTDFHLESGSPVINKGNNSAQYNNPSYYPKAQSDMGAYGGPTADGIPFLVSGVTANAASTTSIDIAWNANLSYLDQGYKVYYGSASGQYTGTDAAEGPSPIDVSSGTSLTLNVMASSLTPTSPVLEQPQPLDRSLSITWSAVSDATSYRIYYSIASFDTTTTTTLPDTFVDVQAPTTSYILGGLTNGTTYYVAVAAIHQPTYYIAVTAYDISTGPFDPGIQHESAYGQASAPVVVGTEMMSNPSGVKHEYPEALAPYPNLPNTRQGCFIATAAYGFYSDPQVMALRRFRDRFLLTNGPGRTFVRWYYTYGPAAADWLNAHGEYKPFVRAALLPLVGLALLTTRAAIPVQMGVVLLMVGFIAYLVYRKRLSAGGGPR